MVARKNAPSTRKEFLTLFGASGLNQKQLADLLGVTAMTANRWFIEGRADSAEPAPYAVAYLRVFNMLPEVARWRLLGIQPASAAGEASS